MVILLQNQFLCNGNIHKVFTLCGCYGLHTLCQLLIASDTVKKGILIHDDLVPSVILFGKHTDSLKLTDHLLCLFFLKTEIFLNVLHTDGLFLHCIQTDLFHQPL